MKSNYSKGRYFEDIGCEYLINNGHKILERNYRVGRIGEIDVITIKEQDLYFIEIKGRNSNVFGRPVEAVNHRKRQKIRTIASVFLQNTSYSNMSLHFIVVEIVKNGDAHDINLIEFDY